MKIFNFDNGFSCAVPDSNRTVFINRNHKDGMNLYISSCEYRQTKCGFDDMVEITNDELFNILYSRDKMLDGKC